VGLKVVRKHEIGEDYITRSFMICTPHQILFGYMARVGEKRDAYGVLVGKPECKNNLEDLGLRREGNCSGPYRNRMAGNGLD
jgi:hypothetical protein